MGQGLLSATASYTADPEYAKKRKTAIRQKDKREGG
jgi:hypothetical protein